MVVENWGKEVKFINSENKSEQYFLSAQKVRYPKVQTKWPVVAQVVEDMDLLSLEDKWKKIGS